MNYKANQIKRLRGDNCEMHNLHRHIPDALSPKLCHVSRRHYMGENPGDIGVNKPPCHFHFELKDMIEDQFNIQSVVQKLTTFVLSLSKIHGFSFYFHFLGSDVRDHVLFRSEHGLILEC